MAQEIEFRPKENSPFTPGQPAPPEIFTGRVEEIRRLKQSIMQTSSGKPQAVFICGERGLGKSSLARFCEFLVVQDNPLVPTDIKFAVAYNTCGACDNVTDVCKVLLQNLTAGITEDCLLQKAKALLGRYIEDISVPLPGFRLSVKLKRGAEELKELRLNMAQVVRNLWKIMSEKKRAVMVILDEVNGVAATESFANFIKTFWKDLCAAKIPILLMLVGLEQRLLEMIQANESVGRIFERIVLRPMPLTEVCQFYENAFASVGATASKDALSELARLSGGYPVMMHELGDATYWCDSDGHIDQQDAREGSFDAAQRVGEKYFSRQVYEEVQSKRYRRILLHTVSGEKYPAEIRRSELQEALPKEDAANLDNFFGRMTHLGVMRRKERGVYEYTYPMFPYYLALEMFKQRESD
jgi:hypothetical protein